MFYHLLYIHLFRPFLQQNHSRSPFPAHATPRKLCTHAASGISRLLRLYKRTYGLRQICNIAVYIAHSACTIHLLNLPDKDALRDIIHGVRELEEIGESWWCARRTLSTVAVQARRWNIELPPEAVIILARNEVRFMAGKSIPPVLTKVEDTSAELAQDRSDLQGRSENSPPLMSAGEGLSLVVASASSQSTEAQFSGHAEEGSIHPTMFGAEAPQMENFIPPRMLKNDFPPESSHVAPTYPSEPSPPAMFGSSALMLEDSQNWWLQDQSLHFESWSQPETMAGLSSSGFGQDLNRLVRDSGIGLEGLPLNTTPGMEYMGYGIGGDQYSNGPFY